MSEFDRKHCFVGWPNFPKTEGVEEEHFSVWLTFHISL